MRDYFSHFLNNNENGRRNYYNSNCSIDEKEGHTVNTFARKLKIPWTSANNIVSGRNAPNYETIMKILTSFSGIDANWLIMGKKKEEETDTDKLYSIISMQQKTIEHQQQTIERLTAKLVEGASEKPAKKVANVV